MNTDMDAKLFMVNKQGKRIANIKKYSNGEGYWWALWKIVKSRATGVQYLATDNVHGVYFYASTLKELRERLPQIDEAVERGEVPEGCSKTKERIEKERVERPYEVKLEAANKYIKERLTASVKQADKEQAKFIARAKDRMDDAIAWSGDALVHYYVGRICKRLLKIPDIKL